MTDLRRDFQRSRRFGIVGVIVVMALTVVIALAFGTDTANPTGVLIAIFVLVFGFFGTLLYLQRRDVDDAETRQRAASTTATGPVTDPTTVEISALVGDLAVNPIEPGAIDAASAISWGMARRSIGGGWVIMILIACAVIPFELTHEVWSIVVFVPAIVGYAIFMSIRLLRPGGDLERAYDSLGPTLEALGLRELERPQFRLRANRFGPQAVSHEMEGDAVYQGSRHGREVTVRIGGRETDVAVGSPVESFQVDVKGERLRARQGSPAAVGRALEPLRASPYWKGVKASGGTNGVVVRRRGVGGGQHWMRDLWLAEHLADAAASR